MQHLSDTICYGGRTHKKQGIIRQENSVRRTSISPASFSADKSTLVSIGLPSICVFREVCVVYVSLSGEYMVSFVQSVEKSILKGIRTKTSKFGVPVRRGA